MLTIGHRPPLPPLNTFDDDSIRQWNRTIVPVAIIWGGFSVRRLASMSLLRGWGQNTLLGGEFRTMRGDARSLHT